MFFFADFILFCAPLGQRGKWWAHQDSNLEPTGYEPVALTNFAMGPSRRPGRLMRRTLRSNPKKRRVNSFMFIERSIHAL